MIIAEKSLPLHFNVVKLFSSMFVMKPITIMVQDFHTIHEISQQRPNDQDPLVAYHWMYHKNLSCIDPNTRKTSLQQNKYYFLSPKIFDFMFSTQHIY
jgi:hypothetical protein